MTMKNFDFDKDVLERSDDVAIVVDYWSPTCGPCLMLGPVLEKLAANADGKWELVKINTMEHNKLAMEHGIQSIPHVRMFSKGKVVSEFVGALPEHTLVKWLDQFIPTEAKEALNAIRERLAGDDREAALTELEAFAKANPDLSMASLVYASEIVFASPMKALGMISGIKSDDLLYEAAENVRMLAELATFEDVDGTDAAKHLAAGSTALQAGDYDAAMAALIEATAADKSYSKELPRRGAISMMRMFGPQHPLTLKYRRKFEMALS